MIFYERHVYESVDDKSLSKIIHRTLKEKSSSDLKSESLSFVTVITWSEVLQ